MVRVELEDDRGFGRRDSAVRVALDPECCGEPWPLVTDPGVVIPPAGQVWAVIRARTMQGFDDVGNPAFGWTDQLAGLAFEFVQRTEYDAVAGLTNVVGTVAMLNPDRLEIRETASVYVDGHSWRVTKVNSSGDAVTLAIQRLDTTPVGEVGS
jgi:hypothetical protein